MYTVIPTTTGTILDYFHRSSLRIRSKQNMFKANPISVIMFSAKVIHRCSNDRFTKYLNYAKTNSGNIVKAVGDILYTMAYHCGGWGYEDDKGR